MKTVLRRGNSLKLHSGTMKTKFIGQLKTFVRGMLSEPVVEGDFRILEDNDTRALENGDLRILE